MIKTHITYLALGTNLGDKQGLMFAAIEKINKKIGDVICQSSFYETKAWGFKSKNTFLNACVKVKTSLSVWEVLAVTQSIERELGRIKKSVNGQYSDRTMDIDILLYDDININTTALTVPHPKMYERDFVMKPLKEIQHKS